MAAVKAAIVTGASRGIGLAIAARLAKAGYKVALFGRDNAKLSEAVGVCAAAADGEGASAAAVAAGDARFPTFSVDIKDTEKVRAAVDAAAAALGGLSVLVCNAAILQPVSVLDGDPAMWEEELDVNVKGTMASTRFALPHILASACETKGVILVGSILSQYMEPGAAGYVSSKHALKGFAGCLFGEVREKGVKVCLIMPGFVATEMVQVFEGLIFENMLKPDDVAHAVECVLSFSASACPIEILLRPQYSAEGGTKHLSWA